MDKYVYSLLTEIDQCHRSKPVHRSIDWCGKVPPHLINIKIKSDATFRAYRRGCAS